MKSSKNSVSAAPEVGLLHTGGNFSCLAGAHSEETWGFHRTGIVENSSIFLISLDLFFRYGYSWALCGAPRLIVAVEVLENLAEKSIED